MDINSVVVLERGADMETYAIPRASLSAAVNHSMCSPSSGQKPRDPQIEYKTYGPSYRGPQHLLEASMDPSCDYIGMQQQREDQTLPMLSSIRSHCGEVA